MMLVPLDPVMEQTVKYLEDLTKLVTSSVQNERVELKHW